MPSTPPPTSRVHTPPAPLHGSLYDNWEPYSPRPTRAASKRAIETDSHLVGPSSRQQRLNARLSAAKTRRSSSSQTFSPPSSPEPQQQKSATARRALLQQSPDHVPSSLDTFNNHFNPEANTSVAAMIPTPAKTPRKRSQDTPMSTARVLDFQPTSFGNHLSTNRKQRKSRLTLLDEDAPEPESFTVFTDAQDRVPDLDLSNDNPFVGPRRKSARPSSSKQPQSAEHAEFDAAVRRGEGQVSVFRGKKVFIPYKDVDTGHEPASSEQTSLKRRAGFAAQRPITRSTVKPQLLWPCKEQLREREARDEDEEAETDIEHEEEHIAPAMPASAKDLVTPAKKFVAQPAQVLTPPSTHRATRSACKKLSFLPDFDTIAESDGPASPAPTPLPQRKAGAKRFSPFETWQRTKSPFPSGMSTLEGGRKRSLSPQPNEQTGRKRTRNTTPDLGHF